MVTKCIIKFCNTIKSGDGVTLHKLPSDAAVQKEWFRAILDETGQTIFSEDDVICSKHFAPSCFTVIDRKPVLNPTAIPFESLKIEGPEPKKIKREKSEAVQCGVFTCGNTLGSTDVHRPELVYHPFPKKQDLAVKWKIFCSKEDNDFEHSYVCSDHFTANDYREQKRNRGKTLKADAIPTIYKREALVDDQSESDQVSVGSGITAEPVYAPKAAPTASDMQWMWSFIDPATSEDELEVNQKFYNFKDLEKKVQQYAKKHGVHKFKIKSSHNIPMNMIKDTENVSEELANNIRALRYREILFCCHTFDLNLSKKKLLLDNTSIKQCPAEVKAAWIKLGEADDDYVEGSIERALLVTRIVNHHDHEFYENTLRDLAKHTKEKRKNVTANSGMGREEKNTSPELIFDSNKKESPEPINYYRLITKGVNTEEEERDIKVTALFDKFKNIMVHKSTSREFNEQLHTLQQILDCFQSNVNILLPTDIPMRNVSTQNASTIRDNSNTSVETNHNVSKENVSQNVSLENRKNVELTDRTKNMVSDYPDESLSVSKDPDFPIFSQSTIATNLDSTNLTNINTSIFRYLQSDATILRRQESRVACNAENENGVDKEENAVEIGMDENNLEVNIEENQNGVVTKNNETEVDTEKKENEVNNEENKNEVDDSVLGIQSIQETAKTSPAKEVTTINAISEGKEPNPDHPPSSKVESGPPSKDRIQPSKKARYVEKSSEELQELAVLNRCMTEISNATPIDEFSVFGDFVASELRNLKFAPDLQSKLKRAIQRIALDVADEYAHRVYDSRQSTSDSEMKISPGNTLTENTDISSDNEIISPENT